MVGYEAGWKESSPLKLTCSEQPIVLRLGRDISGIGCFLIACSTNRALKVGANMKPVVKIQTTDASAASTQRPVQ